MRALYFAIIASFSSASAAGVWYWGRFFSGRIQAQTKETQENLTMHISSTQVISEELWQDNKLPQWPSC